MPMSRIPFLPFAVSMAVFAIPAPAATAQAPAVDKEDLRYDGFPYAHWKDSWRKELKPECRVETVRALAAFGTRGYAEEAAGIILEIAKGYDIVYNPFNISPKEARPEELLVVECLHALRKIGPPAAAVIV